MITAYMRISTTKEAQKHDRQKKAIADYARDNGFTIDEWYKDTISGKISADSREDYQCLKRKIKAGSTVIVSDLDRLGRDATDTIAEIKDSQHRGIRLIALDIPYMNDFNRMNDDSMSRMIIDIVITLKAHMAEQEREKTVSRIKQSLAATVEKGTKLGRKKKELSPDFIRKYEDFLSGQYGKMSVAGFAKMLGVSRSTLYNYIGLYEG